MYVSQLANHLTDQGDGNKAEETQFRFTDWFTLPSPGFSGCGPVCTGKPTLHHSPLKQCCCLGRSSGRQHLLIQYPPPKKSPGNNSENNPRVFYCLKSCYLILGYKKKDTLPVKDHLQKQQYCWPARQQACIATDVLVVRKSQETRDSESVETTAVFNCFGMPDCLSAAAFATKVWMPSQQKFKTTKQDILAYVKTCLGVLNLAEPTSCTDWQNSYILLIVIKSIWENVCQWKSVETSMVKENNVCMTSKFLKYEIGYEHIP